MRVMMKVMIKMMMMMTVLNVMILAVIVALLPMVLSSTSRPSTSILFVLPHPLPPSLKSRSSKFPKLLQTWNQFSRSFGIQGRRSVYRTAKKTSSVRSEIHQPPKPMESAVLFRRHVFVDIQDHQQQVSHHHFASCIHSNRQAPSPQYQLSSQTTSK